MARADPGYAVLAMPIMYHVEPETFGSLWIAASHYSREKLRYIHEERTCVWEARNRLATRFLEDFDPKVYTDLIMVDSDMVVPCGNPGWFKRIVQQDLPDVWTAKNFFDQILSHDSNVGIVGAAYFDRRYGRQIQCYRGHHEVGFNERFLRREYSGLLIDTWVATGGMRIKRWALEQMIKEAPRMFPEIIPNERVKHWGFFTPNRVGVGEDVSFCLRAGAVGIKSYVDADLRLMHKGSKCY